MRRPVLLVLFSWLLLFPGGTALTGAPQNRVAQRFSASSYFPLRVGNLWVYQPSALTRTVTVADPIAGPDGLTYFTINNYLDINYAGDPHTRYVRADRTGRVQEIDPETGETSVLYFLGAAVGTTWSYQPLYNRTNCNPTAHLASRTDTLRVPAGEFHDVVRIDFDRTCADFGFVSEWFAPGIGLIKRTAQSIEGHRSKELVISNAGPSSRNFSVSLTLDRTVYLQDAMPILDRQRLAVLDTQLVLRNQDPEVHFVFQGCKSATFRILGEDGKEWIRKRGDDGGCCACASPVDFALQGDGLLFRVRIPLVLEDGTPLPGGSYALEATLDDVSLPDMLRPSARLPFAVILVQ